MRKATLVLLALGSMTCASSPVMQTDLITRTLQHDGLERTYHVYVPATHKQETPVPLVMALHGGGGQGLKFDASTRGQMRRQSDQRGWVVVYPEGIKKLWNEGREKKTRRDTELAKIDDVAFLSALIDKMQMDYGIDTARVYAMGISNGGFMSLRLATDIPGKVAAVAAVTASLGKNQESKRPTRPVGVLLMNGTDDPLVPYAGGQVTVFNRERGEILSTNDTIDWWRARNACSDEKVEQAIPDEDANDGTTTVITRYPNCAQRTSVVLYRIVGGGHAWPGGRQYLPKRLIGRVSRDFDGAEHIFNFFAQQPSFENSHPDTLPRLPGTRR